MPLSSLEATLLQFDVFHITGGDIIAALTGVVLFLSYRIDRRNRMDAEQKKHDENVVRLNALAAFHQDQLDMNEETEEKLDKLGTQLQNVATAMTGVAATMAGIDRRTTRIENQLDNEK